jgi:hypothetical protein
MVSFDGHLWNTPHAYSPLTPLYSLFLFLFGQSRLVSSNTNLPKPTDRNKGAKIWLVPTSDINCNAATKTMNAQPNYNMYMFSKDNQFLKYDYLG